MNRDDDAATWPYTDPQKYRITPLTPQAPETPQVCSRIRDLGSAMLSKMDTIEIHEARVGRPKGTPKTGGRQRGTANLVTREVRATLRDLAEVNANHVQGWLDRVAENDPAEATRLWLALLRFVTPTLQAAAIADLSPPKSASDVQKQLYQFTDDELTQILNNGPSRAARPQQGVAKKNDLATRLAAPSATNHPASPDGPAIDEILL